MTSDLESRAEAAIIGIFALTPKEEYLMSFEELAALAAMGLVNNVEKNSKKKLRRANFDGIFLSSSTVSNVIGKTGQHNWETIFASHFGVTIDIHSFLKGSEALHTAITEIKSGDSEFVIVAGCDKRSDELYTGDISDKSIDPNLRMWNWSWQNVYATAASRYLYESETDHDDLISVAINDNYNAKKPPKELKDFQKIRKKSISRLSFDPLTQSDFASTKNDGAAAVLLTSVETAKEYSKNPVYITASSSMTGASDFWNQRNPLSYPALEKAVDKCYSKLNIDGWDLDLMSIDTKATIVAPLVLEALKIWEFPSLKKISNKINELMQQGFKDPHIKYQDQKGRELIINPCGGTYMLGNIPGVSGLYRMISLVEQLYGNAKNQVTPKPCSALLQEQSASGTKQMINILEVTE
ncbi:MAG: hypothetical protein ACTSSI_14235 [Candidatus Helarchaeota archaeon]